MKSLLKSSSAIPGPSSGAAAAPPPLTPGKADVTLINELWEEISRRPPAIEARKLLIQHLVAAGWVDAAIDAAQELIALDASSSSYLDMANNSNSKSVPPPLLAATAEIEERPKELIPIRRRPQPKMVPQPETDEERVEMEKRLIEGYQKMRERAAILARDTKLIRDFLRKEGVTIEKDTHIEDLKALSEGKLSAVVTNQATRSARMVARSIEADPGNALDIATTDLEDVLDRLRDISNKSKKKTDDELRDALAKRVRIIVGSLPDNLQHIPRLAMMHMEHEYLHRNYQNTDTMYGDDLSEVARDDFWASEDGYAWSMDELAAAIKANGGIMRNPLSKEMFSPDDVKFILQHPKGKILAALQIEQSKLSKGVRPATVDKLDSLSKLLLQDQSDDQIPSRQAMGTFSHHRMSFMI
jgi:hypothetical protein